jgi:2-dehydropantoate 2-reductase
MAEAGHDVTLIARNAEHVRAIREKGLRITGIWGEHHASTLRAQTDLSGLRPGEFDLFLVTVKSYDTANAVHAILPLVDENSIVCAYQNGLGNAETIAESVGWGRTIGARAIFGALLVEPGHSEVTVIANPTAIGAYSPGPPEDRVREIAEAMNASGVPTVYTDKIATLLWGKVAYNCVLNPLSALLDAPFGALPDADYTLGIMRDVVEELYAVAKAMGVPLEPVTAPEYMELLLERLIPPTAAHYASMHEDFDRKRRTEIDALNGAISRYGEKYGVSCPTNTFLTRLVHAKEHIMGVRPQTTR